jgi:CheY-like chemotaxis protein
MILVEMLRQVGIGADTATNGREAVDKVRVADYDILFMDIQMPEMDGFTATREIRHLDREGVDRLPILAIAARTSTDDRERCLDAGMNDYLNKPVNRGALDAVLRKWLPRGKYAAGEPDPAAKQGLISIAPQPGLDLEGGLKRLGDNRDLYLKLLHDFVAGYADTPERLRQELRQDRREEAIHRVHTIRGVAGNLGGINLEAAAAKLETACRAAGTGVPSALEELLRVFSDRHQELIIAIGAVLPRQAVISPVKPDGPPGDAAELRPLLLRLKTALESEEPWPCKEIMKVLLPRHWTDDHEAALTELNRLIQRYRLADAITLLDNEFKDILGKAEEKGHD